MTRYKQLLLATLIFGVIFLLLVGCQQLSGQFPLKTNTPVVTITSTESNIQQTLFPENTPPPLVDQPREITLWLPASFDPNNGTEAGTLLKAGIADFSETHPGILVSIRIKAETGVGGLLDSLTTASSAAPAALPELVLLSRSDFEKAAASGLLLPMEDADLKIDRTDWFPFAEQLSSTGKTINGVAFAGDVLLMAYKKARITYPSRTWEEVYTQNALLSFPAADPDGLTAIASYLSAGGSFQQVEGKLVLDEKALQDSLQIFYDGASAEIFPHWLVDHNSFSESTSAFPGSQAAYTITWSSLFLTIDHDKLSITDIPSLNDEKTTLADGWVLAFPQSTNDQFEDTLDLVEFLLDPGFQQTWSEAAGYLPVSRTALSGWSDSEVSSILIRIAESAQLPPPFQITEIIGPLFSEAIQEIIKRQISYIQASDTILMRISE